MSLGVDSSDKIVACGDSIVENPACCSRSDGSSYILPCCPSATFNCESEQFDCELCGFTEYSNGTTILPSVPPKKYRKQTETTSKQEQYSSECCFDGAYDQGKVEVVSPKILEKTYDILDCTYSEQFTSVGSRVRTRYEICSNDVRSTESISFVFPPGPFVITSTTEANRAESETEQWDPEGNCTNKPKFTSDYLETYVKSDEDTEADAIARATGAAGTSCSSRWETRNTQFDWIKRTSGYKIECSDLVVGVTYTVTPSIRKRTAQDDGSGTWEDVTVTPVDFTATSDTETIDDGGDFIDLDHIQGWEYEITAVSIEKKA